MSSDASKEKQQEEKKLAILDVRMPATVMAHVASFTGVSAVFSWMSISKATQARLTSSYELWSAIRRVMEPSTGIRIPAPSVDELRAMVRSRCTVPCRDCVASSRVRLQNGGTWSVWPGRAETQGLCSVHSSKMPSVVLRREVEDTLDIYRRTVLEFCKRLDAYAREASPVVSVDQVMDAWRGWILDMEQFRAILHVSYHRAAGGPLIEIHNGVRCLKDQVAEFLGKLCFVPRHMPANGVPLQPHVDPVDRYLAVVREAKIPLNKKGWETDGTLDGRDGCAIHGQEHYRAVEFYKSALTPEAIHRRYSSNLLLDPRPPKRAKHSS